MPKVSQQQPHSKQDIDAHVKVQLLVRAYQVRGHIKANLDPLGISKPYLQSTPAPELEASYYEFSESDLNNEVNLGALLPQFSNKKVSLSQMIEILKETYCISLMVLFYL